MLLWWWLAFCVIFGCTYTVVILYVARSRRKRPVEIRETGAVLDPVTHPGGPSPWRVVGAGILVGKLGKVTATSPLVVLDVAGGELSLRMRPRLLAAAFGVRPLHALANSEAVAFPARGWFGSRYVGIRAGHSEGYFMTSHPAAMLGRLQAAGFNVTWVEQKITYL